MKRKQIIVIEGIDGCGKQTQSKLIIESLQKKGEKVISASFPNYNSLSSAPVKMYLNGELSSSAEQVDAYQTSVLFATDRFCTVKKLLKDESEWSYLIFDRYVSSNMLHQGGKIKDNKELIQFVNWLDNFEFEVMKIPRPDIIFYLYMPLEKSLELMKNRTVLKAGTSQDLHEKDKDHLLHAHQTGEVLSKMFNWKIINCLNDNNELKSPEEISLEIQKQLGI